MITARCSKFGLVALLAAHACKPLTPESSLPPPAFGGVTGITLTTAGAVELLWAAPTTVYDEVIYKIYQANPESLPTGGVAAGEISGQSVQLYAGMAEMPAHAGTQIGQSGTGALVYTLKGLLDDTKNYTFQVVAANLSNGNTDSNNVVLGVKGFGTVDYKGCLTAVGVDYQSIKITFDVPAQVSTIIVLRNGQSVYNSSDPAVTSWVDTGLSPGQTYEYSCNVVLGNQTLVGPTPLNATTLAPFQTYKGCIAGTAVSANGINLTFDERPRLIT